MKISEYKNFDALGLSQLVLKKEVTAKDLLELAISLTEESNSQINAVTTKMYDIGLETAKNNTQYESPFFGVPFLIKDLGILYKGVPTTNGSHFYKNFVPDHDSELVKRFKNLGLVTFGKTNTSELGLSYTTEPLLFGPCRNPWDVNLSTGGSSGGAAAAVALGILPIAHASDGGGSIRVPSSCCGVFGMKPTRARVPVGPDIGEIWSGLGTNHAISRTVRDSAAMLDALSYPEIGDPYYAPEQKGSFLEILNKPVRKLKIAFTAWKDKGIVISQSCEEALQLAAKLSSDLGHHVEEATPDFNYELMRKSFLVIAAANARTIFESGVRLTNKQITVNDVEPLTWELAFLKNNYSAVDYVSALTMMHNQSRKIAQFFTDYDILITPTLAKPPVKIGTLGDSKLNLEKFIQLSAEYSPFTWIFNMTGQPAMSVPLYWDKFNHPIGTQFIGKFGDEATLFQIAHQLEQLKPWKDKKPPPLTWLE